MVCTPTILQLYHIYFHLWVFMHTCHACEISCQTLLWVTYTFEHRETVICVTKTGDYSSSGSILRHLLSVFPFSHCLLHLSTPLQSHQARIITQMGRALPHLCAFEVLLSSSLPYLLNPNQVIQLLTTLWPSSPTDMQPSPPLTPAS